MEKLTGAGTAILIAAIITACGGPRTAAPEEQAKADTISVPDTGYTGIKQYYTGNTLIKEVTFENGVRNGLMKSFYNGKQVRQTFWYKDGLREDSARWYYVEGPVFRSTPYVRDTIHGIQQQYFKSGRIKARIGFEKGLRTFFLEEFAGDGSLIRNYPEIIVTEKDNYKTDGTYRITLELSDKSQKVKYYRGDFGKGIFDTAAVEPVKTVKGVGNITLRKTGTPSKTSVEILAEILTNYGNNYLLVRKIDLPYKDLK